jgi:hypothetical protein
MKFPVITYEMTNRKLNAEIKQSVKLAFLISMQYAVNITSKFKNHLTTGILYKVGLMVLYTPFVLLFLYKVFVNSLKMDSSKKISY